MSTTDNHGDEESNTELTAKDVGQEFRLEHLPTCHIVKRECSVLDCNNDSSKSSLFAFPKYQSSDKSSFDKCKLWLNACGNDSLLKLNLYDIHQNAFVCSSHFNDDQFEDNTRNELVSTAVPALLLPLSMSAEKLEDYFAKFPTGDATENGNDSQPPTTNGENFEAPQIKQESGTKKEYRCSSCTKRFADQDTLETHWKVVHCDDGPLECVLCDKTFLRGCDYRRHTRIHTTKMRYVCLECERCFSSKVTYTKHLSSSHSEGSPYYCAPCNRRFSSNGCLKSHLRTHSGEKHFACTVCDKRFFTNSYLKAHRLTHSSQVCKCSVCGLLFPDKETLKNHFNEHEKGTPFACNKCPRRFSEQKHLMIHLRTHSGTACFKCKDCNKRCPTEQSLQLHMKSHLEDEPVICPHCKTQFSSLARLVLHFCRSARGKRNVCPICSQQFPTKSVLDIHMPIHDVAREPIKPYACSICYKRYLTKRFLDSHTFNEHHSEYVGGSREVDPPEPKEDSKAALKLNLNETCPIGNLGENAERTPEENTQQETDRSAIEYLSVSPKEDTIFVVKQEVDTEEALPADSYGENEGNFVLGS